MSVGGGWPHRTGLLGTYASHCQQSWDYVTFGQRGRICVLAIGHVLKIKRRRNVKSLGFILPLLLAFENKWSIPPVDLIVSMFWTRWVNTEKYCRHLPLDREKIFEKERLWSNLLRIFLSSFLDHFLWHIMHLVNNISWVHDNGSSLTTFGDWFTKSEQVFLTLKIEKRNY